MATFTLAVVGYLNTFHKQGGLTFEQVKTVLEQHGEVYDWRIERALKWAANAQPGEHWESDTDLRESDQANVYLTRE